MLGIFKIKRSASSLASFFAARMPQLMSDTSNPALQAQFQALIEKGANPARVRPEVAALHCFLVWAGISIAHQRRKITDAGFNDLVTAYFEKLEDLSAEIDVSETASLSYSTFGEWLMSRIDRYIIIATTETSEQRIVRVVTEHFCDFACDKPPSAGLMLELLSIYIQSSGKVVDILSGVRLQ